MQERPSLISLKTGGRQAGDKRRQVGDRRETGADRPPADAGEAVAHLVVIDGPVRVHVQQLIHLHPSSAITVLFCVKSLWTTGYEPLLSTCPTNI